MGRISLNKTFDWDFLFLINITEDLNLLCYRHGVYYFSDNEAIAFLGTCSRFYECVSQNVESLTKDDGITKMSVDTSHTPVLLAQLCNLWSPCL